MARWDAMARKPVVVALALLAVSIPAGARIGMGATDLTASSFDSFVRSNDRVLVDFYDPSDAQWNELNQELQSAVRDARGLGSQVPIAKVNAKAEAELAQKYIPNGPYPQLMWFQHGEPTQYHRTLRKSRNILDFVMALDRTPIQAFSSEEQVRKSANRVIFAQIPKASQMYRTLEVVASKHMDTVEVAHLESPGTNVTWLEEGKEPAVYPGSADVDTLDRWVRGQLTRSEPLPEPQEGDSIPVVGANFEDVVLRPDKDVFLLIYAPWCGYSRKFIPTWESLARRVAHIPHLVVAKMDGDRNGSPFPEDFKWNAYPTVFFVPAGLRKPKVFHGNRTLARLISFAREHGSRPLPADLDAPGDNGLNRSSPDTEWEL